MKKLPGILLIIILLLAGCGASRTEPSVETTEVPAVWSAAAAEDALSPAADLSGETSRQAAEPRLNTASEPAVFISVGEEERISEENGTRFFISKISIPHIEAEDYEIHRWISGVMDEINRQNLTEAEKLKSQALEEFRRNQEEGEDLFYSHSFYGTLDVSRMDRGVISLTQLVSVYSGGAHPNNYLQTWNLDIRSRKLLVLEDVIYEDKFQNFLDLLMEHLDHRLEKIQKMGLFPNYRQIIDSNFENPKSIKDWYFGNRGLVIYFDSQEIAPYAAGIIKAELPYGDLHGILRPEYGLGPKFYPQAEMFPGHGGGCRKIYAAEGAEAGETVCIQTDSELRDLRIYRICSWITPEQPMLGALSASLNRLSADEAVCVPKNEDFLMICCAGSEEESRFLIRRGTIERLPE